MHTQAVPTSIYRSIDSIPCIFNASTDQTLNLFHFLTSRCMPYRLSILHFPKKSTFGLYRRYISREEARNRTEDNLGEEKKEGRGNRCGLAPRRDRRPRAATSAGRFPIDSIKPLAGSLLPHPPFDHFVTCLSMRLKVVRR